MHKTFMWLFQSKQEDDICFQVTVLQGGSVTSRNKRNSSSFRRSYFQLKDRGTLGGIGDYIWLLNGV